MDLAQGRQSQGSCADLTKQRPDYRLQRVLLSVSMVRCTCVKHGFPATIDTSPQEVKQGQNKVGGQRIHSWFVVECVGRGRRREGRDDSKRGKKKRGDGGWERCRSRNMRGMMWVE